MSPKTPQKIIEHLQALVSPGKVLTDEDALLTYGRDFTRLIEPAPLAIVFPRTTEEVRDIVHFANEHQVALVPSGGRTGLSAGAVASSGEVVVAFDAMNQILAFDPKGRSARCQAGVITRQLQLFAEEKGLYYPVDFASAGSSQLGGNLSTNAGGIKVIRYGMSRDWVAGLTVVTGRGDILELGRGLVKNATGYDLRHLFIGAEGTLGFITEATMKLTRRPKELAVLVLGVRALSNIMEVLQSFQEKLDLCAFEFFSEEALKEVLSRGSLRRPFDTKTPFYALLEVELSSERVLEELTELFTRCVERGQVEDGVISQSSAQARSLWRLREDISESISRHSPYKNDISVKISSVPAFLEDIQRIVTTHYPDLRVIWFGHIGDGNLHLNILKPEEMAKEEFVARCKEVNRWVFEAVERYGGSISAEHGVGLLKREYLGYSRSPEELAYLRAIKRAFDPNNIINPGKLIEL